jgi:lipopolysaccharide export system protein LptC
MSPLSLRPNPVRHFIQNLSRPRAPLDPSKLARRRAAVVLAKRLLPTLAFLLLASVALWPEIDRTADRARGTFEKMGAASTQAMHMRAPHYRGIDQRGEPYTITAAEAGEPEDGRYDLATPKADLFLQSADKPGAGAASDQNWLMVWSDHGTYRNHLGALDLTGEVTLYRGDGMIFSTNNAAIDLRQNAVLSADQIHGEGPLGTLDGQGFALLDHGALLQIAGPVKLVLNAARSHQ